MFKELIICIVIIISITILDVFTQNFTKEAVKEITESFSSLKESILKQDKEKMNKEIENIINNWENKQQKLAYYIEHDELEKVETAIVEMKSYIETDFFPDAIAKLEEGKFVLKHIQEKNSFNLKNIF